MPKKIIKKALDELSKDKPDISYLRGMLEVLYGEEEISPLPPLTAKAMASGVRVIEEGAPLIPVPELDEAAILDAQAKSHIAKFGMPKIENE